MQKTYLYLMVCVIGAMSLASCSEDSISPDAGGDGDGDSTTEVPLAQVAKPKPNPWLAQEEYSITHFNSAQTDAFSSAVKGTAVRLPHTPAEFCPCSAAPSLKG